MSLKASDVFKQKPVTIYSKDYHFDTTFYLDNAQPNERICQIMTYRGMPRMTYSVFIYRINEDLTRKEEKRYKYNGTPPDDYEWLILSDDRTQLFDFEISSSTRFIVKNLHQKQEYYTIGNTPPKGVQGDPHISHTSHNSIRQRRMDIYKEIQEDDLAVATKQIKMEEVTFATDTGFFDRQFDEKSPVYINIPKSDFLKQVVAHYAATKELFNGYADFCKVIIMPNSVDMKYGLVEITEENQSALISKYEGRPGSLPVLTRSFSLKKLKEQGHDRPIAHFLYVEMYTAEQMKKEDIESGKMDTEHTATLTIFNVKPLMTPYDFVPNAPITMMRNALGPKYGGSGKEIDTKEYTAAVEFFTKYAFVDHLN